MTRIEQISEGMVRQCAWERIKHKCKVCSEIIGNVILGYLLILPHIILLMNFCTMKKLKWTLYR